MSPPPNTNLSIDTPGSLASTALITGVVLALALFLVITVYIITRRQRSKNLRAKRVGRRWINEVQYEIGTLPFSSQSVGMSMRSMDIGMPPLVRVRERGRLQSRGEERGRRMERGFEDERRRVWRSPSVARGWRRAYGGSEISAASASWSGASSLEIERQGSVWYSRPVGGEYDDADADSLGRMEWFGDRRWRGWERDEEVSVGGGSFVTAMEG